MTAVMIVDAADILYISSDHRALQLVPCILVVIFILLIVQLVRGRKTGFIDDKKH